MDGECFGMQDGWILVNSAPAQPQRGRGSVCIFDARGAAVWLPLSVGPGKRVRIKGGCTGTEGWSLVAVAYCFEADRQGYGEDHLALLCATIQSFVNLFVRSFLELQFVAIYGPHSRPPHAAAPAPRPHTLRCILTTL